MSVYAQVPILPSYALGSLGFLVFCLSGIKLISSCKMRIALSIDVLPRQKRVFNGRNEPTRSTHVSKRGAEPRIQSFLLVSDYMRVLFVLEGLELPLEHWFPFFSIFFFAPERPLLAAWVNLSTTRVPPMLHSVSAPETSPNGPNRPKRLVPKGRLSVSTFIGNRARVHAFYRPLGLTLLPPRGSCCLAPCWVFFPPSRCIARARVWPVVL